MRLIMDETASIIIERALETDGLLAGFIESGELIAISRAQIQLVDHLHIFA